MADNVPDSSILMPTSEGGDGFTAVHLLVMGLSGVGKSTFISKATKDPTVVVGAGISGVTQDVEEYILYHKGFEVHLIDSPGFDDNELSDHKVLDRIGTWINTVYSQGWNMGGILYLYDVTRSRLGASGEQNIRVLEEMTGKDKWKHISLVTTKWNWSGSYENELQCERELQTNSRAWKSLIQDTRSARLCRFLNTTESALEIIQWHLDQSFEPALTYQMANPQGPKLSLGETNAGQVILNSYTPTLLRRGDTNAINKFDQILSHKFDDQQVRFAVDGLLSKLATAKREHRLQQIGRWAIRLSMVGGAILVTLLTENPTSLIASAAAGKKVEERLQRQRRMKKDEILAIKEAINNGF